MRTVLRTSMASLALALPLLGLAPAQAAAQGRGNRDRGAVTATATVTLSTELKAEIGRYYASRPAAGVEALPPGIRRRLERGKPLPPGIAKKSAPPELRSRLEIPSGYEIVEVGLDVLLVEVATSIVHDVLMDIVR